MEIDDIIWVSCDVAGSHVIDVFLTSSTVTPPRRKKLVKKLKVHQVNLQCFNGSILRLSLITAAFSYTVYRQTWESRNGCYLEKQ